MLYIAHITQVCGNDKVGKTKWLFDNAEVAYKRIINYTNAVELGNTLKCLYNVMEMGD
jgi:hypothetical protein